MITHEHLKTVIEDIYSNDNRLTQDLLTKLINELRYSHLLIPAKRQNATLNFIIYEIDGKKYTPLFTDNDEFKKFFKSEDLRLIDNSFELYQNILKTRDIEGYILNPSSQNYIFEKEFVLSIKNMPKINVVLDDSYDGEKLKEIYDSIDNSSLNEFINKRENIGDYEALFEEFSKSTLLTLMVAPQEIPDRNGIIDMSKTGPLAFMHVDTVGGKYLTIYSSKEKLKDVNIDSKLVKYAQIINLSVLVNYVLAEDMDGVILNPDSDNVLIPRFELLKYSLGFEKFCNDVKLSKSIFYIFLI